MRPRRLGWGRLLEGGRLVPAFALVAVASLVLGLVLARAIQPPTPSPQKVAAGFITAPVERKTLRNEVVLRADASFADAVAILAPSSGGGGEAIVTGALPAVGDHVSALAVVAEVSGRPIILLPGSIPAYRTLSFGMRGADVLQLKSALLASGFDPGDAGSNVYDAKTAAAVGALYQRVGYSPVSADAGADDQVRSARDGVTTAQDALDSANRALATAKSAVTPQVRLAQDNTVRAAQRAEQAAQRALTAAQAAQTPGTNDPAVADAEDALANAHDATTLALAERAAALADPDTRDEVAAVTSAQHALASAQAALASASNDALPILPSGEVAFVSQLPRRVDAVKARVGSAATGSLLSLSGADLALVASVSPADAALLAVGDEATFERADGGAPIAARVASIEVAAPPGSPGADAGADASAGGSGSGAAGTGDSTSTSSSRMSVTLAPEGLSDEQVKALDGSNVRVTIPVGATAGNVLAVPLAAVSLGPGGASRVQVLDRDGRRSFLDVTTGLVARGDVEVSAASGGSLRAGDKVVVGR